MLGIIAPGTRSAPSDNLSGTALQQLSELSLLHLAQVSDGLRLAALEFWLGGIDQLTPRSAQIQTCGTAVTRVRAALQKTAFTQSVNHPHHIGRQHRQLLAELARSDARIAADQRQHGELHNLEVKAFHALDKDAHQRQRCTTRVVAQQRFEKARVHTIHGKHFNRLTAPLLRACSARVLSLAARITHNVCGL